MKKILSVINSRWFQWSVAIVAFVILFSCVDIKEIFEKFINITPSMLIFFLYISVVLIFISSLKWQLFIESRGEHVSVFKLFNLYVLGYFINSFVPSYFGGDAVRSWYVGKKVNVHQAFAATFLERYTGIVAMLILSLIFMWNVKLVTPGIRLALILLALFVALGTYFLLQPKILEWFEKIFPFLKRFSSDIAKFQEALRYAHTQPILMIKALVLSLLFHMCTVVNVVVAAYCIGWVNVPFQDLFVVLPIILLIAYIPISPSGLGIQEGAYFYFLQGLGATRDQALAVSLALRAKQYILAVFGAFIWFYLTGRDKNSPTFNK